MADYSYTTTEEMRQIDPILLDTATRGNPIFDLFPITRSNSDRLIWEQRDSYRGLQQVRGLNGEPRRVTPIGRGKFSMEPGVYGEFMDVDEMEMTRRANAGNPGVPVAIGDLVNERQEQLVIREANRQAWIGWELLLNGKFSVTNEAGAVVHQDGYDQQVYTASVAWATVATATPIANFRAVARMTRGTSASLGADATAWMNQITFDSFIGNTNDADLGGKIVVNRDRPRTLEEGNAILSAYGLPNIRIYDDGYLNDAGTFTHWIPDNKVVVIGRRTNGAPLGEMRLTRNVNNPDGTPGFYNKVIDFGEMKVPRKIEVHRGWNGGIVLFYPGAICVMNV